MHVGDFKDWGVDRVLRDIGVSDKSHDEGGTITCLTWCHGDGKLELVDDELKWIPLPYQVYEVNGKTYDVTGARYGLGFEPRQGGQ